MELPAPDYVEVYEPAVTDIGLSELGRAARRVVDGAFDRHTPAVLFRGLHRIRTAAEFKEFWSGCTTPTRGHGDDAWKPHSYFNGVNQRETKNGVDLASAAAFPSHVVLPPHNEESSSPRPPGKIAFFCLHSAAEGGETILARNSDVDAVMPARAKAFIREHGGINYSRRVDQSKWPALLGVASREEAVRELSYRGYAREAVSFDSGGSLLMAHVSPGFIRDNAMGSEVWFNYAGATEHQVGEIMADGEAMPAEMVAEIRRERTAAWRIVKLRPGDWLICDNLAVAHGRLPFKQAAEQPPRTLLTVYTKQNVR